MRLRFVFSAVAVALVASPAYAHFELVAPDAYSVQDPNDGSPQKSPPCGQEDTADPMTPTDKVDTLMIGSQLAITIDEKITHPGHYRAELAQDLASLPADPAVTAGTTECGSTVIEANPVLPMLADGQLVHTASFGGKPQTFMVTLPSTPCNNCVLQVVEFMSDHPMNPQGGCFYHHCAMVNIVADAPDAGVIASADAGGGTNPRDAVGGCCSTGSSLAGNGVAILIVGGVLLLRRRRR